VKQQISDGQDACPADRDGHPGDAASRASGPRRLCPRSRDSGVRLEDSPGAGTQLRAGGVDRGDKPSGVLELRLVTGKQVHELVDRHVVGGGRKV
jgi:hypothetical protein